MTGYERTGKRVRSKGCCPGKGATAAEKAANLAKSLALLAKDPSTTTFEERARRLTICSTCPMRRDNNCLDCGCNLPLKVMKNAFRCELGYWDDGVDN